MFLATEIPSSATAGAAFDKVLDSTAPRAASPLIAASARLRGGSTSKLCYIPLQLYEAVG